MADSARLAQAAAGLAGIEFLRLIRDGELPRAPIQETLGFELVRPITGETGEIRAEGRLLFRGGRVATADGSVTRASDGKLLAHGTSTCLVLSPS